jgi:P-type Cu+ transporter
MAKNVAFKIEGMHCSSCAMDIDLTLEDTKGVSESNTNYAKSETSIKYDEKAINEDRLKEIIKSVGYEVA